jgi:hypothetical protein
MVSKSFGQIVFSSLLAIASVSAHTNVIQFQSASSRTALLELYTSEGCSSCPPAEAWLSGLRVSPRLWRDFAPVAFHVDYWDYLGWKDPWAEAEFSERQRSYSQLWHADNVYTPEWALNGKEWHNWFAGKNGPKSDGDEVGILTIASGDRKLWQVSFSPAKAPADHYEIHAALLTGGIVSNVQAGENRGRQLRHDFAVVDLVRIGLTTSHGTAQGRFLINAPNSHAGTTPALVAWITQVDQLQTIQATGGWLVSPGKN